MFKNKKSAAILITVIFAVITLAMAFVGIMQKNGWDFGEIKLPSLQTNTTPSEDTSSNTTSSEEPTYILPENMSVSAGNFNTPGELRAVFLTPGEDFYKNEDDSVDDVKKDIDSAVKKAKEFSLNTVVVFTDLNGKVIYNTPYAEMKNHNFDTLDYVLKTARANEMHVYAVLSPSHVIDEDNKTIHPDDTNTLTLKKIYDRFYNFTQNYSVDGVILNDYYYEVSEKSYVEYVKYGYNMGYSDYQEYVCETHIRTAAKAIRAANNNIQICLYADGVWLNSNENELGSETTATFQAYKDGRSNTKKIVEQGIVDAVFVEALGSLTANTIPFENIISWWNNRAELSSMPMYIIHAATKVGSSSTGWTLTDQLVKQIICAKEYSQYKGSCYNSLTSLVENKGGSTTALVSYYNNELSDDLILKDLAITKPSKRQFITTEPIIQFAGASAPAFDLLFNGEKLERDETGFFSIEVELKPGVNEFSFEHKGKTTTYKIERKVEVLKEISPTGSIAVDGGDKITVSALAYKNSTVTATLGSTTVTLKATDDQSDSTDLDSDYQLYTATITAPAAGASDQNLGSIKFSATWEGYPASATGATVRVNKKAVLGNGKMIKVTAKEAETFPTGVLNDYSHPDYFPLPLGTIDRVASGELTYIEAGVTYKYYKLDSGVRVYSKDIQFIEETKLSDNVISGMTVTATNSNTKVIFKTKQKVPFIVTYDGSSVILDFKYTKTVPPSLSLSKNPLFSSATWSGTKLTLKLKTNGGFLGFNSYYEDGELVLRFNNPILIQSASNAYGYTLNGTKIAIDSGHGGGNNPGAVGVHPSYPESTINQGITKYLKNYLENLGASVHLIDSVSTDPSLAERVNQAKAYNAHIMISVHQNSALSSSAKGTEAFYFNDYSKALATAVSSKVANAIPTTNRGAKFGYYYVTRDTQFPAILLESGFISNTTEHYALMQSSTQQAVARAIVNGIISYANQTGGAASHPTGVQSSGEMSDFEDEEEDTSSATSSGTTSSDVTSSETTSSDVTSSQITSSETTSSDTTSSEEFRGDPPEIITTSPEKVKNVATLEVDLGSGEYKVEYMTFEIKANDKKNMEFVFEKQDGDIYRVKAKEKTQIIFTKSGTYIVTVRLYDKEDNRLITEEITYLVS